MLVELIEVKQNSDGDYMLSSIYVNSLSIVYLSENRSMKFKLQEGKLNLGLNQNFTSFTDVRLNHAYGNSSTVTVVGDPGHIELKILNKQQKQLLKS